MSEINAVWGSEQSDPVTLTASASDTEVVEEPKYASLETTDTLITLPDESQYIVVTKIGYSVKTGICSFFLHGGESPTQVQVGPKVIGAASTSDVLDVHLRFPMGAPVKMNSTVAVGAELVVWVEYHIKQTQNTIPSYQDYA
jgi:hypothetical protein